MSEELRMALLEAYDPPARMTDFDLIEGQREAWHKFVLEAFDSSIGVEEAALQKVAKGATARSAFFSAVRFDPGPTIEQAVLWNAFPKELLRRFGRRRALIEADQLWPMSAYRYDWRYNPDVPARTGAGAPGVDFPDDIFYRPLVEYCEWHVDRDPDSGRIRRVCFTSEPPEYWFAMYGGTVPGSSVPFPGSKDLVLELYRKLVSPKVEMKDLQAQTPINSPFGNLNPGDYNPHNKWNTTHGIVHLTAPPNALTAEIQLGADATQLYHNAHGNPVVDPDAFIAGTGMGGPNRNSDPTIAATVNALARAGAMITLANPVGLYMDHIDLAGWEFPGGMSRNDCVHVVRGQPHLIERLVVEVPGGEFTVSDITIGGVPIAFGGHIAECITVKLVGAAGALGSTNNPSLPMPTVGNVDPVGAREVFVRSRMGVPNGTIPAFVHESGELEQRVTRAALASARPVRGVR
ncbi:hypothetical protein BSZ19_02105 [Bradyrhizobium japonicum]|uniref:Uncharacterized protein n=2 Tax=Nitrobacteraceae TaxID=41294 RepID=A0A1Y2JXK3_BRAJP|nr:hypothetical protein BSZ19_02105 [Bradyrhizobium japonicum]